MKKAIIFLLAVFTLSIAEAQKVMVKSVFPGDLNDLTARMSPRKDSSGKNCALIRVGIIGVKDMNFPDAIGNVMHEGSEYHVYVPEGLKSLRYNGGGGRIRGKIEFKNYPAVGTIASNRVYHIVFDTENHQRMAIIKATPQTATLIVDGKPVKLDADGIATVEKPVGTYRYRLSAPQYETQEGKIDLIEDELSITKTINLERVKHAVIINGFPSKANLTVDGDSKGPLNLNGDLNLSEGFHTIHLQAEGYDDYEQTINVMAGMPPINISMQKKIEKEVTDRTGTSHTSINLRPGHYLTFGGHLFDKKKYDAQQWGISINYSAMQHFAAIFALREGISYGISFLDKDEMKNTFESTPKDTTTMYIEVPLQIGISVQINSFGTCLFSVMGGGYGKYMWTEMEGGSNSKSKDAWDYGLRLSAILELSKFIIGAEVSSSLNQKGIFYGLHLGYNLGKKNRKK